MIDDKVLSTAALLFFGVVGPASVLTRLMQGRPIFPKAPQGAVFEEWMASGRASGLHGLIPARNCLMVTVDADTIRIVPFFPFNLMFAPDIFGLERTIPRPDVIDVKCYGGLIRHTVAITYADSKGPRRFYVDLRKGEVFERLLRRSIPGATA